MSKDLSDASGAESAVIVALPQAERAVGNWRARLDPTAALGIPAHVTILYPFVQPDQLGDQVLARLTSAVQSVARFHTALARVGWFDKRVVWLAPEPDLPFRQLTAAVCAEFPDHPPYGDVHLDVVPHLTIGADASPLELETAGILIKDHLPIQVEVWSVQLFCGSRDPHSWGCVAEISLTE